MRRWYHMARALTPILRGSYNEDAPHVLGDRLAVGRRALDPLAGVRILLPQPPGHNRAPAVLADDSGRQLEIVALAEPGPLVLHMGPAHRVHLRDLRDGHI